jgi:hypothetical protein
MTEKQGCLASAALDLQSHKTYTRSASLSAARRGTDVTFYDPKSCVCLCVRAATAPLRGALTTLPLLVSAVSQVTGTE